MPPSGAGRSRPSVQLPAKGSDLNRPRLRPSRLERRERRRGSRRDKAAGRWANHAQRPRLRRVAAGVRWRSNSRSRQCRISFGSGIFTGQTLSHLPQKVEAFGSAFVRSQPGQARRQHAAHRPRIDPAVGMAADRAIDRAIIHAGGAANAAEHILELAAEHAGAAIIHQHDMILLRPVQIARPARASAERRVHGEILPGRRARQHAQQARCNLPASAPPSRSWRARYARAAASA